MGMKNKQYETTISSSHEINFICDASLFLVSLLRFLESLQHDNKFDNPTKFAKTLAKDWTMKSVYAGRCENV